jgi:hypothetical protein
LRLTPIEKKMNMKQILVLLSICLGVANEGYAQQVPPSLAKAIPLDGIQIDGMLADWPEQMLEYPISNSLTGSVLSRPLSPFSSISSMISVATTPAQPADLTARYRVGYSIQHNVLYVALIVRDDEVVLRPARPTPSNQDLCELFIDADHSGGDKTVGGMGAQQYVMVGGASRYTEKVAEVDNTPGLVTGCTHCSGVQGAVARWGEYTIYEWSIPLWKNFPNERLTIAEGKTIGFDAVISDADGSDGGDWLSWSEGVRFNNSDTFGDVVFVAGYTSEELPRCIALPGELHAHYQERVYLSGLLYPADEQPNEWGGLPLVLRSKEDSARVFETISDAYGRYRVWAPPGQYELYVKGAPESAIALELQGVSVERDFHPSLARISVRSEYPVCATRTDSSGQKVLSKAVCQRAASPFSGKKAGPISKFTFLLPPGSYRFGRGSNLDQQQRVVIPAGTAQEIVEIDIVQSTRTWPSVWLWSVLVLIGLVALPAVISLLRPRGHRE